MLRGIIQYVAGVLLVAASAASLPIPGPPPPVKQVPVKVERRVEPFHSVVFVSRPNGFGHGVLVGERLVLTARHVGEGDGFARICGVSSRMVLAGPGDIALMLTERKIDGDWLDVGSAVDGEASVIVYVAGNAIEVPVRIYTQPLDRGCHMTGLRSQCGFSGAPVIQNGKVVGVITQFDPPHGSYWQPVGALVPLIQAAR